ncbi:MAG: hypothetical protein WBB28_15830 [Crinalium sp.]
MGSLIDISSPQAQLRQNRTLLLLTGGFSTIAGLFLWSLTPFIFNNPKDKVGVCLRYLSLFGSLGCGVAAVASGHQLQRISPLIKAIETAEKNDFLDQLASSQYVQQSQWQQMAMTALQPPSSPQSSEVQHQSSDAQVQDSSSTYSDELTTSTSSEVTTQQDFHSLYKSVSLLKEQGISDTKIIEEVLGMGGRKFSEGKQMLDALLQLGESQQW